MRCNSVWDKLTPNELHCFGSSKSAIPFRIINVSTLSRHSSSPLPSLPGQPTNPILPCSYQIEAYQQYYRPWLPPPWITTDDRVRGGSSRSNLSAEKDNRARFYGDLDIEKLGGAGFASQFSPVRAADTASGAGDSDPTDEDGNRSPTAQAESEDRADIKKWDLNDYDGVEVVYSTATSTLSTAKNFTPEANNKNSNEDDKPLKIYTLILKDRGEKDELRVDGRAKSGVNWEYDFHFGDGDVVPDRDALGSDPGPDYVDGKGPGKVADVAKSIWIPWGQFRATFRGREVDDAGELRKDGVWRVGIMMRR